MRGLEAFAEIIKENELLAPFTRLKVGGPAEALAQPRGPSELAGLVERCSEQGIPLRVLGAGCNVLIRDEGVRGVVLRLAAPEFSIVTVEGTRVRAGTGAALAALVSQSTRHALAGLEPLVGIPGTVGGALRRNAGDRAGEIGQCVRAVEVLDGRGKVERREQDELQFAYGGSNLDEPVILAGEFELEPDDPDVIVKRMRKAWIQRKAAQPLSFQASIRVFKDPRGLSAAALIEQAGLARTRVGGAEVSDRDANAIVTQAGTSARDVLRLIDLVHSRVQERFDVDLELQLSVW